MKRILIVIGTLSVGGAEKVARDIGLAALAEGYTVHYLVFGEQVGEYESVIRSYGGDIFRVPSPSTGYIKYYHSLIHLLRENRYDVVHAHTMFSIGWAMLAAKKAGVPIRIAHAHSALNDGRSMIKTLYEHVMRQLILRYSTDLIACGDAAGVRLYGEKSYRERGRCILNGIDTAEFTYNPDAGKHIRNTLGWEDAFIIGHVGHLAAVKNQSFLIRLMPKILKEKPNAKLLLLGDGEDRPVLENLVREQKLSDSVILTGNVRNVPDCLSAMDVFAFPSLYEGMPLSVLEVQANGLPCVLSTGVPKDVFQTDLIRPLSLDHPEQWVQAICSAKRVNPEKYADELRQKGFDTQSVMQKFLKIYERAEKP